MSKGAPSVGALEKRILQLEEATAALEVRVGARAWEGGHGDSSTSILLDEKVKERTNELETALDRLEKSNRALQVAKERAEEATRSKDRFLATMSHELRTPLNAILGLSEILIEEFNGPLNERQRAHVEHITESGRHLLSLINDVLDLARVGAGEVQMHVGPVRIAAACEASLHFVDAQATKKGITVASDLPSAAAVFECDERRLKQILINLLSNAVKFTPAGGKVDLDVTVDKDAEVVSFTVTDNGIGIENEKQETLFRPFTQLDSGLSREYDGTGLGLSLVSHMTLELGGLVTLASEPGAGSRFTVILPWVSSTLPGEPPRTPGEPPSPAPSPLPDPRSDSVGGHEVPLQASPDEPRILVVEDNEFNQEVVLEMLEILGYSADLAKNGREALELFDPRRHVLILMDLQMPEMDGYEATEIIRGMGDAGADVAIVALTANAQDADRRRCLAAGMNDHVSKPIDLSRLKGVLGEFGPAAVAQRA